MNPPNADILELKEMMRELFKVVQGIALGQKVIAEKVEKIEKWLLAEKVQEEVPSSVIKKPSGNGQLKKEVEAGGVQAKREHGKDRYHPYADTATIPTSNQSAQQQQPPPQLRTQRAGGPRKPDQRVSSYDENVRCEFHAGAPGHHIEDCKAFKHVVQDLVDSKAINFAPTTDDSANPATRHGPVKVKLMSTDRKGIEVTEKDQLKMPMSMVPKPLRKEGACPSVDNCCAAVATKECVVMGKTIHGMMKVEMGDVRCKTSSLAVETVKVENAIGVEKEKKPSISSYKQAVEVVKNGGIPGWGKIIGIVVKADMFGIGYQEGQDSSEQNRGRRPPFAFISAGMLDPVHADAVSEEIDSDRELESWIKSCVPGNWKA
ncbi:hypothetical protein KIW84_020524 [Lathyrus oleraceus]|uniref:Uncharacterized protein n=1 Tax=Pisum sativum TaxID=3888 RepID=A0A9D4YAW2_PEA|nr:hypothetical protein KIW84_020524 [Pisum sativum]